MPSSRLTSSICILSITLLLQTVLGADPLFSFCSNSENFTANGPYESNLNKLITRLSTKVPPTGFGLGTIGSHDQYQAYGSALCRGDVAPVDCKSCIVESSTEIRKRCPYNKGAIIWYDNCMFKYLDTRFFGQIDNQNKFYMWNVQSVSNPTKFNKKAKQLLSQLAHKAYASPNMYASGELKLEKSMKLYGLAQCTRDLSSSDCKTCLDGVIGELPRCCDGKEGGRVVGGSCNVRYEIYPFVKE